MAQDQMWWISCGDMKGSVAAPSAEAAFLKLADNHNGVLSLVFRAASKQNGKGRYYSTERVLREAGLLLEVATTNQVG